MVPEPFSLPPHAFVPGGTWPRPRESRRTAPEPISGPDWFGSPDFGRAVVLFNAGYYWEAHEAWEGLWHAHGRKGPIADVLKGLIKLAAAGVKVREGQPYGVVTHARRAADLFRSVREGGEPIPAGLELETLEARARAVASAPPTDPRPPGAAVSVVFAFRL